MCLNNIISDRFFWCIDRKKLVAFGFCVVYTKTIVYLSVGESGGFLLSYEVAR